MAGAKHRAKGARIERQIVALHEEIGIKARRVPLSGATHYQDASHDVDVYPFGADESVFTFEVKARKHGNGFRMLDRWLDNAEGLFLRPDRDQPLVVLSWQTWVRLLEEIKQGQHVAKQRRLAATLEKLGLDAGGHHGTQTRQTNGTGSGIATGPAGEKALIHGNAPDQTVGMADHKTRA